MNTEYRADRARSRPFYWSSGDDTIIDFRSSVDKIQAVEYSGHGHNQHVFGDDHQLAQGFFEARTGARKTKADNAGISDEHLFSV